MLTSLFAGYARFWLEESHPVELQQAEQKLVLDRMKSFEASHSDVFLRTHKPGHFTGSALVFDLSFERLALTHHKKLGIWLQFGGHADGDSQLQQVALREAQEESGLSQIEFSSQLSKVPLDLDIHEIPAWKSEPSHLHYDLCFLMTAPFQDLQLSEESNQVRWFSWSELATLELDQALQRRLRKIRYLLESPELAISSLAANPAVSY